MNREFYHALPSLDRLSQIFEGDPFVPVPDDWWVAWSDVVGSTAAIEAGRYKEVNTAGSLAAMALGNAFGGLDFPFFFGGDGMVCLVPGAFRDTVAGLLAGTARRVREAFGLTLRIGLIPVAELRRSGHELRLAKIRVSDQYSQAVFSGDGFDEAERWLKAPGSPYLLGEDHPGADEVSFDGYSCRWKDFASPRGKTVALILRFTRPNPTWSRNFLAGLERILGTDEEQHPLRPETHRPAWGRDLRMEARVIDRGPPRWTTRLFLHSQVLLANFARTFRIPFWLGKKNIARIVEDNLGSSDWRKFDNTLKMVVSVGDPALDKLRAVLEVARSTGQVHYGLHVSDRATLTCLMHTSSGHEVHFVDAADGGYAFAARDLKRQLQEG